jgi:ATP-dependent DNA ligase
MPHTRRKRRLERLIATTTPLLSRVLSIEGRGRDMLAAAQQLDLEGVVAERKSDPYVPEATWYKVKNRAYTQAEGRWELFNRKA